MARTTRTAVFMFLASTFFCAPVWAQSQEEALRQMAASMATMSQAMQRLAQTPQPAPAVPAARPTLTHTLPAGQVGPDSYFTREEWNVFLAGDFANLKKRVGRVESLAGRIAPRQSASPATPAKPVSSDPVASANAGPGHVKVTPPPAEQFRSVAFTGDVPSQKDVDGIKNLLGSRYELAQVIWLPTPGANDLERAVHGAARAAGLATAYGSAVATRPPADDEEARQLVVGAPVGTGVVFHLRLK